MERLASKSKDTFPPVPFLRELRLRRDLEEINSSYDFPIFQDPEIARLFGRKGTLFGKQIQYKLFWNETKKSIIGVVYFPYTCEGPPGSVHGGALATALDSVLGSYSFRIGGPAFVTASLNTTYKQLVPLGSVVRAECHCEKRDGRKLFISAKLTSFSGSKLHTMADAMFYQVNPDVPDYDTLKKLFGRDSGVTKPQVIRMIKANRQKRAKL